MPYELPPFDLIEPAHFRPALEEGMAEQRAEIATIVADPAEPDVDNTLVALERSGRTLDRATTVLFSLIAADTTPELNAIEAEFAPRLAAHHDAMWLNRGLFARVDALYRRRDTLGLDPETSRLLDRYHRDFVRAGARLDDQQQNRLKELNQELSALSTRFSQAQLAGTNAAAVVVDDAAELAGLGADAVTAAAAAATARGLDGKYLLTLNNFTMPPQTAFLTNADLRERLYRASIGRGSDGSDSDTSAILLDIVRLRAERARLLGFSDHASYVISDQTAASLPAVDAMLGKLIPPATRNAAAEATERAETLGTSRIDPWDWSLATERLRKQRYDFDSTAMRPYLELERVLTDGLFFAANKLYGLTFTERFDLPVYHPQVRVFEVFEADGSPLGLFLADHFTRDSKRRGAWMNNLVDQSRLLGQRPVVINNLNIARPPTGQPVLLTLAEVTTMFHEFGHALHGLFSDVTYPRFSGTAVPRDFVEFPSQVNEMWVTWPDVLANFAVHHETGEPMPQHLVDRLLASQQFNEGFATTEYLASAFLDLAWHRLPLEEVPTGGDDPRGTVERFEADALASAGLAMPQVPPRYRSTYFGHIFAGGYSAGYYSYIWSEVLDADTVEWFKSHGGLTRANGDRFRERLLSRGGSVDALDLFRGFTGHDPDIRPLLDRRGLGG